MWSEGSGTNLSIAAEWRQTVACTLTEGGHYTLAGFDLRLHSNPESGKLELYQADTLVFTIGSDERLYWRNARGAWRATKWSVIDLRTRTALWPGRFQVRVTLDDWHLQKVRIWLTRCLDDAEATAVLRTAGLKGPALVNPYLTSQAQDTFSGPEVVELFRHFAHEPAQMEILPAQLPIPDCFGREWGLDTTSIGVFPGSEAGSLPLRVLGICDWSEALPMLGPRKTGLRSPR